MSSRPGQPASLPRLHSMLVRRAIVLVVGRPLLRRIALRIALRYPGLLQRFKRQIKDVMLPADTVAPALPAPAPSGPATVLGPRFKQLIREELDRLDASAHDGEV